jgi:hypothetical protein
MERWPTVGSPILLFGTLLERDGKKTPLIKDEN